MTHIPYWCPVMGVCVRIGADAGCVCDEGMDMTKMLIDRSVVEQALEALEYYQHRRLEWDYSDEVAITALKAALAEPVQEPCTYKCETWPECECAKPWQSAPPQRPAEPVQEPDSPERRCGGPGCDMTCCQPVQEPAPMPPFPPVSLWKRGCAVCGIGAGGHAYGYACPRSDCPTRVTCGGTV